MTLLMGAFLGGVLAALVMPFLAFACVLLATILAGSVVMGVRDGASLQIVVSAFVLLLSGQLGFWVALLMRTLFVIYNRRRGIAREGAPADARPIWSKRRDRAM